jgi:hypothetical protein
VLVANVVLALLATFAVVLRIVARRLKKVALGADDIAIIIALVRNESTRSRKQRADAQQPFSLLVCISTCVGMLFLHDTMSSRNQLTPWCISCRLWSRPSCLHPLSLRPLDVQQGMSKSAHLFLLFSELSETTILTQLLLAPTPLRSLLGRLHSPHQNLYSPPLLPCLPRPHLQAMGLVSRRLQHSLGYRSHPDLVLTMHPDELLLG